MILVQMAFDKKIEIVFKFSSKITLINFLMMRYLRMKTWWNKNLILHIAIKMTPSPPPPSPKYSMNLIYESLLQVKLIFTKYSVLNSLSATQNDHTEKTIGSCL